MEEQDRSRGEEGRRGHLVQLRPGDRGRGHDHRLQQGLPGHPGEPGPVPGFQLVEKINTESSAGRVQADVYQCGGQSGRTLTWRGLAEDFIPPTALDPNVKWRWPIINKETHLAGVFASVSGLNVNTKLVPPDKYPKSYWDLVPRPVLGRPDQAQARGVHRSAHRQHRRLPRVRPEGSERRRSTASRSSASSPGSSPSSSASTSPARWRAASSTPCSAGRGASSTAMGTVPITKLCLEPGCVSTQSPLFAVVQERPASERGQGLRGLHAEPRSTPSGACRRSATRRPGPTWRRGRSMIRQVQAPVRGRRQGGAADQRGSQVGHRI
mgnify:CR=1 FL=1